MAKLVKFIWLIFVVAKVLGGGDSDDVCAPALSQLVHHGVATPDLLEQLPSNGSSVCKGGPCCVPSMSSKMVSRGRRIIHAIVQREAATLLEAVTGSRDAFKSAVDEVLILTERRSLELFRSLYPRLYGHVKEPIQELFMALRTSLTSAEEGTVERELNTFWNNLFPLAYHNTVHSHLAPFSHAYMECLRKSRESINPWKVFPKLIGETLAKGLDTARLMMHALNVGIDVILNARSYEIPEECGIPAAKLHFCGACHGILALPCSGLCLNVARGCLAPLAEVDGSWAELGKAVTRVDESIRSSGLIQTLRDLPERFSDVIMITMESGPKLQKLVRNQCGAYRHEESHAWKERSEEGFAERDESSSSISAEKVDPDAVGRLVELRASEVADVMRDSRRFWIGLADGACAHLSAQDTNCWNGAKLASYSRPAASYGVSAQKYNPEVQILKPDMTVHNLANQLKSAVWMVKKQLGGIPESDSYRKGDQDEFEGSADGPRGGEDDPNRRRFLNHDDEDIGDDGMGSGSEASEEKAIETDVSSNLGVGVAAGSSSRIPSTHIQLLTFSIVIFRQFYRDFF